VSSRERYARTGQNCTKAVRLDKMRLAARSNQSEAAVAQLEAGRRRPLERKVQAIKEALEDAGVEFTETSASLRNEKARL